MALLETNITKNHQKLMFFPDEEELQEQDLMKGINEPLYSLPFWLGNEEEEHIRHIVLAYEQALHIYSYHNEAESLFPRGEYVQLPLFIGKIVRNVLMIDSETGTMETVDAIDVYMRDMFVRRGVSMPLYQRVHVRTIWDIRDGIPIHFNDCSLTEYSYLCKYGLLSSMMMNGHSGSKSQLQPSSSSFTLYSFPKFRHYCQYRYQSFIGNENLIVSYGSLLDGCLQKISIPPIFNNNNNQNKNDTMNKKEQGSTNQESTDQQHNHEKNSNEKKKKKSRRHKRQNSSVSLI